MKELIVIGGGLAGCEAAWQAARRGIRVVLFEMRPEKSTEAHRTGLLGELVCSNSFRSDDILSAPGLLKQELRMADSLIMKAAEVSRVPAGSALAVDRVLFSAFITDAILGSPNIVIVREEIKEVPDVFSIVATGPLTSDPMAESLGRLLGKDHLCFYDAIAPIVSADSIDYGKVYEASRYGKGGNDYINCPMTEEEYDLFYKALLAADGVVARDFEDERVFEGCMPVEVMARRGRDTLRFGPMKPVGLPDPRTGKEPYAVVQLRAENNEKSAYNMVGFQTRLKWTEQKRVFRMIPGLGNAVFTRLGSMHRNTFVNSPVFLKKDLSVKLKDCLFLSGQLTGVEGYIESTAMGLVAGINAVRKIKGEKTIEVPAVTAHGALINHITSPTREFQPSNVNFGLFPAAPTVRDRRMKKKMIAEKAVEAWRNYLEEVRT